MIFRMTCGESPSVRDQVSLLASGAISCVSKNRDRSPEGTGINCIALFAPFLFEHQLIISSLECTPCALMRGKSSVPCRIHVVIRMAQLLRDNNPRHKWDSLTASIVF